MGEGGADRKRIKSELLIILANVPRLLFVWACVQFALQSLQLAQGEWYIVSFLTNDDTYYYLQTAWNTRKMGFVTFDGLHPTNGVQLAWFGIVLLLAILSPTKASLLIATLTVCHLLNVICYVPIWKIARIARRPNIAWIMAGLWAVVSFTPVYSKGLENSFHAFIFWCVVWQAVEFLSRLRNGKESHGALYRLVGLLILNVWTRLDAAVFSFVIYACCCVAMACSYVTYSRRLGEVFKLVVVTSLWAAAGAGVALVSFSLMGGSFLPVSSYVKTSGARWGLDAKSLERLVTSLALSFPPLLPDRAPAIASQLLGLSIMFSVFLLLWKRREAIQELAPLAWTWTFLLISMALYHFIVVVYRIEYSSYYVWYRSPFFVFWIITIALSAVLLQPAPSQARKPKPSLVPALIGVLLLCYASIRFGKNLVQNGANTSSFHYVRYQAALCLAENWPADAIYAAWNAGELAYFSGRTFVNLDGLINSADYYRQVLSASEPTKALCHYLSEEQVDYIVDYVDNHLTSRLPVVDTLAHHPSGKVIRIWRVDGEQCYQ